MIRTLIKYYRALKRPRCECGALSWIWDEDGGYFCRVCHTAKELNRLEEKIDRLQGWIEASQVLGIWRTQ